MKQKNDLPFGKENKEGYLKVWTLRWDQIDQKHRNSQEMSKVGGWMQADSASRPAGPGHSASDSEFGVGVPASSAAASLGQSPAPVEQIGLLFSSSSVFPPFKIFISSIVLNKTVEHICSGVALSALWIYIWIWLLLYPWVVEDTKLYLLYAPSSFIVRQLTALRAVPLRY